MPAQMKSKLNVRAVTCFAVVQHVRVVHQLEQNTRDVPPCILFMQMETTRPLADGAVRSKTESVNWPNMFVRCNIHGAEALMGLGRWLRSSTAAGSELSEDDRVPRWDSALMDLLVSVHRFRFLCVSGGRPLTTWCLTSSVVGLLVVPRMMLWRKQQLG